MLTRPTLDALLARYEAMADAEARLGASGRIVVRASGTEPLIRVMAEGDDEKLVRQVVKDITDAVKAAG